MSLLKTRAVAVKTLRVAVGIVRLVGLVLGAVAMAEETLLRLSRAVAVRPI
jgi:hypothetical protein